MYVSELKAQVIETEPNGKSHQFSLQKITNGVIAITFAKTPMSIVPLSSLGKPHSMSLR